MSILYNEFNDIPENIKVKFKGKNNKLSKQAFLNFINTLIQNGHELIGDYVTNGTKTIVDYKCQHGPKEIKSYSYMSGSRCMLCFREKQRKQLRANWNSKTEQEKENFKEKMKGVSSKTWEKQKSDEDFMKEQKEKIKSGMNNMMEEKKEQRKRKISDAWKQKTQKKELNFIKLIQA